MLARLGMGELIIIFTVAFLVFGPKKLPELGKSLGETIKNFKYSMSDAMDTGVGEPADIEDDSEESQKKQGE